MTAGCGVGRIAIAAIVLLALAGCAATPAASTSPTGDRVLEVHRRDTVQLREEFYRVDREGRFGTSGGAAARQEEVTWSMPLAAAQIEALLGPPGDPAWWEGVRAAQRMQSSTSSERSPLRTTVRLVGPGVRRSIAVEGEIESVEELLAALRELARRRHEPQLDALPEAGERFRR